VNHINLYNWRAEYSSGEPKVEEIVYRKVLHEPQLDTILMVEQAILDSKEYPSRTGLWKSLPRRVQYQTFLRILTYLEASGKIAFHNNKILYTGVNNPKLLALMRSSVRVK
jgi:hypothetical protein